MSVLKPNKEKLGYKPPVPSINRTLYLTVKPVPLEIGHHDLFRHICERYDVSNLNTLIRFLAMDNLAEIVYPCIPPLSRIRYPNGEVVRATLQSNRLQRRFIEDYGYTHMYLEYSETGDDVAMFEMDGDIFVVKHYDIHFGKDIYSSTKVLVDDTTRSRDDVYFDGINRGYVGDKKY